MSAERASPAPPAEPGFADLLPHYLPPDSAVEPGASEGAATPALEMLDLHGHSCEEALHRLPAFVRAGAEAGYRELIVIHGRGAHSEDGTAVLRRAVRTCLRAKEMSTWVRDIQPKAGSADGATTINLRRVAERRPRSR